MHVMIYYKPFLMNNMKTFLNEPPMIIRFTTYRHINFLPREKSLFFETKALDLVKIKTSLIKKRKTSLEQKHVLSFSLTIAVPYTEKRRLFVQENNI